MINFKDRIFCKIYANVCWCVENKTLKQNHSRIERLFTTPGVNHPSQKYSFPKSHLDFVFNPKRLYDT